MGLSWGPMGPWGAQGPQGPLGPQGLPGVLFGKPTIAIKSHDDYPVSLRSCFRHHAPSLDPSLKNELNFAE